MLCECRVKLAQTETVSFPPFWDIGPPTHLLGVGRGNLTNPLGAFLNWVIQKKQDIEGPGWEKEDKNINEVTKSQKQSCCGTATWRP